MLLRWLGLAGIVIVIIAIAVGGLEYLSATDVTNTEIEFSASEISATDAESLTRAIRNEETKIEEMQRQAEKSELENLTDTIQRAISNSEVRLTELRRRLEVAESKTE